MSKYDLDGTAIPLHKQSLLSSQSWPQEHVNVEMWGIIQSEGKYGFILYPNHTYKALRIVGDGYDLLYTVWCSNEHELYDMKTDPWQMDNIYTSSDDNIFGFGPSSMGRYQTTSLLPSLGTNLTTTTSNLLSRLDALLLVLKTCKMDECRFPWSALHSDGDVRSLRDALEPRFDGFYASRPRVQYEKCERGYIAESEGTMWDKSMAIRGMEYEVWSGA